jgi:Lon protease-like protein
MRVEYEYMDVLQNIVFAVMEIYGEDPDLLDHEVLDAYAALIRIYTLEERGDGTRAVTLSGRSRRVFEAVRGMCEWRMGRGAPGPDLADSGDGPLTPVPLSDILRCLKRLRKSVETWTDVGGRRGYLTYVSGFFGEGASAVGV